MLEFSSFILIKYVVGLNLSPFHAVNLLIWKKILSLTLFKIITVSRPTTLIRVFLMRRSGCPTKGGNLEGLFASPKVRSCPFRWISPPPKNRAPPFLSWSQIIYWEKKVSLLAFRQILPKIKNFTCGVHFQLQNWLIWESLMKLSLLIQNSVQQDYLPELYPGISLLTKMSPPLMLLCCTHQVWTVHPFP